MAEKLIAHPHTAPPPGESASIPGWVRKNLFSSVWNSIQTILALGLLYLLARAALSWVIEQAQWGVVIDNFRLLMVGQYPINLVWRVWLCLYLIAAVTGLSWGVWARDRWQAGAVILAILIVLGLVSPQEAWGNLLVFAAVTSTAYLLGRFGGKTARRTAVGGWILILPIIILIIRGISPAPGWFTVVPSNYWGGLLLTFLLTSAGILFSFPLGVLLALGRRSQLPVIRWVSIIYIEVIRGVPLITILFMASTMVPLFLPLGVTIDRVFRALVGITLFSAAYLAENVRGGLQAIPRGQYEAAHALGLNALQTMGLIILPQALRLVIPVLVGQFISLFKDTSLVATIGLLDLLGIARSVLANPKYISFQHEVLVFITIIYWSLSYGMSLISQRLEQALGVGER